MTTQKSFSMCVYYIRSELSRKVPLYIPVNELQLKIAHTHRECTHAFAVPTPTQLECCFFRCGDEKKKPKKKVLLTSEKGELTLNYKLDIF